MFEDWVPKITKETADFVQVDLHDEPIGAQQMIHLCQRLLDLGYDPIGIGGGIAVCKKFRRPPES